MPLSYEEEQLQSTDKKHHSTKSALLKVKNDILWNMDAYKVTLLVILDLSAAFDTVRHGHLARSFEVKTWRDWPGTQLIYILLSYRTQRFAVNGGLSDTFPLPKGGSQGSCLGPLLFKVYISQLFQRVGRHLPSVLLGTRQQVVKVDISSI